jgi:hypothetical protein
VEYPGPNSHFSLLSQAKVPKEFGGDSVESVKYLWAAAWAGRSLGKAEVALADTYELANASSVVIWMAGFNVL